MDTELLTLGQELAEISRLVEADDLRTTLDRYVARVERTVPGCDHASITVGTPGGGAETVAGGDEKLISYRLEEPPADPSPILDVITHREPRRLDDIDTDRRWPAFSGAMRRCGYRSAIALPLAAAAEPAAAFALFSREPERFVDTSYDLVLLFALHAGVVFDNASLYHDSQTLVANLRQGLVTRALIGQAQGLVMHRHGYDGDRATTVLKTASQHHNIKLRELARTLVGAHEQSRLDEELDRFGMGG